MTRRFNILLLLSIVVFGVSASRKNGLLLPQKVAEAKKAAAAGDSAVARGIAEIIAVADNQLEKGDLLKADYLGMAYLLTDDDRYAKKAFEVLQKGARAHTWADKEMMMRNPPWQSELNTAHRLFAVANAYDAIYDTLTPSQRKELADNYYRLAIKPLAEDWVLPETRIHTLNSMGHNWWSSCVGMCGIGALAFRDELPQSSRIIEGVTQSIADWFDFQGDDFQGKPRTLDRNGGMYESINYGGYGYAEAMLYLLALKNATGQDVARHISQLKDMTRFFVSTSYPTDSTMMTAYFGDSHKHTTGHNAVMLLDALSQGSPDGLWYLANITDGQHREFMGLSTPVGLLYTPRGQAPAAPATAKASIFPDMGWATMRDSYDPGATMLAVKSGLTWNHAHADAASFILFHKGHDVIGEAGRCWYKLPEYRNYYFQAPAHNVVLLDGQGQPTHQQYHGTLLPGKVSNLLDTLDVRYLLADATGPNADRFNRYLRSFLWLDGIVLIIDDLATHEQGEFTWLWHPIGEVTKKGIDLDVRNGDAHVLLRQLYPETLAPSDFIHDYPTKMTWECHEAAGEDNKGSQPYWSFHLPKSHDRVKGVTAIILDGDNPPAIERRSGDGWIGLRITTPSTASAGSTVTDIYINQLADGSLMHCNSWISPDGYTTDAYILAVSRPANREATPPRYTMVYGSTLKDPSGRLLRSSNLKSNHVWR